MKTYRIRISNLLGRENIEIRHILKRYDVIYENQSTVIIKNLNFKLEETLLQYGIIAEEIK